MIMNSDTRRMLCIVQHWAQLVDSLVTECFADGRFNESDYVIIFDAVKHAEQYIVLSGQHQFDRRAKKEDSQ